MLHTASVYLELKDPIRDKDYSYGGKINCESKETLIDFQVDRRSHKSSIDIERDMLKQCDGYGTMISAVSTKSKKDARIILTANATDLVKRELEKHQCEVKRLKKVLNSLNRINKKELTN